VEITSASRFRAKRMFRITRNGCSISTSSSPAGWGECAQERGLCRRLQLSIVGLQTSESYARGLTELPEIFPGEVPCTFRKQNDKVQMNRKVLAKLLVAVGTGELEAGRFTVWAAPWCGIRIGPTGWRGGPQTLGPPAPSLP